MIVQNASDIMTPKFYLELFAFKKCRVPSRRDYEKGCHFAELRKRLTYSELVQSPEFQEVRKETKGVGSRFGNFKLFRYAQRIIEKHGKSILPAYHQSSEVSNFWREVGRQYREDGKSATFEDFKACLGRYGISIMDDKAVLNRRITLLLDGVGGETDKLSPYVMSKLKRWARENGYSTCWEMFADLSIQYRKTVLTNRDRVKAIMESHGIQPGEDFVYRGLFSRRELNKLYYYYKAEGFSDVKEMLIEYGYIPTKKGG